MAKKKMSTLDHVSFWLVVIGGINWGLIGIGDFNLVNLVLGSIPVLERLVYLLVGVSALYAIYMMMKK